MARGGAQRALTTVLIADVVGYSRLTHEDEDATVDAVRQHLRDTIRPALRRNRGRLIKTLGDGVLAVFTSPVNAAKCALELQAATAAAGTQLSLRIGINLGDVRFEDGDVLGDAVNIAARLQTLAEPGEIIAADSVAQLLRGKIQGALDDLGGKSVKNIPEPVHVWRLRPATKIATTSNVAAVSIPAIAVLPFQNLSEDPQQSYFSDGFAEDVIIALSRFRTLSVIARTSSFMYRDQGVDVAQIGSQLGASFAVQGSVRKIGDRIRINVQLVRCKDRGHIWAERYDTDLSNLFGVQDELTQRIVATLVPRLEEEELQGARRRPTQEMRAYDCYLRGREKFYAATDQAGWNEARDLFEAAIAIDDTFARAYCYLAALHNRAAAHRPAGLPVDALRETARSLSLKAVSLDASDPLAQLSVAWAHIWRGEFDAAERHLEIATRLNPNDADRAMDRGTTLVYLGQPEKAIEVMSAGMQLNPFHNESYAIDLAEAYFVARRYDDMLAITETLPHLSLRFMAWRAAALALSNRVGEAQQQARAFVDGVRRVWEGDPGADEPAYVQWLLSLSPFKREEDRAHLVEGLGRAGIRTGQ
jgi:TolB-like protein/class 3 adenylate cyclase